MSFVRITDLENRIRILSKRKYPFTNVIGLTRSVLALGLLLTLITNSSILLMHKTSEGKYINPLLHSHLNEFNFFLLFGFEYVDFMRFVAIIILLFIISGYFIGMTSIFHWWLTFSFFHFSSVIDGGDHIASIITLFLIPLCLADPRKNHWNNYKPLVSSKNLVGIFSIYLIRFQIAVIYFHAAIGKFFVKEWADGTAIYYWVNHSFFGMPLYISDTVNTILANDFAVTITTYSIILIELMLSFCLFSKKQLRQIMFPIGVIFHIAIIYFLGIFSFFFSMLACLIIYLIPFNKPLEFKLWSRTKACFSI